MNVKTHCGGAKWERTGCQQTGPVASCSPLRGSSKRGRTVMSPRGFGPTYKPAMEVAGAPYPKAGCPLSAMARPLSIAVSTFRISGHLPQVIACNTSSIEMSSVACPSSPIYCCNPLQPTPSCLHPPRHRGHASKPCCLLQLPIISSISPGPRSVDLCDNTPHPVLHQKPATTKKQATRGLQNLHHGMTRNPGSHAQQFTRLAGPPSTHHPSTHKISLIAVMFIRKGQGPCSKTLQAQGRATPLPGQLARQLQQQQPMPISRHSGTLLYDTSCIVGLWILWGAAARHRMLPPLPYTMFLAQPNHFQTYTPKQDDCRHRCHHGRGSCCRLLAPLSGMQSAEPSPPPPSLPPFPLPFAPPSRRAQGPRSPYCPEGE